MVLVLSVFVRGNVDRKAADSTLQSCLYMLFRFRFVDGLRHSMATAEVCLKFGMLQ